MGILSTIATSRRGYLSQDELKQFANINITDPDEADDQISQAEEIIGAFCRRANKFLPHHIEGQATDGTTLTLIDTSNNSHLHYDDGYYVDCEIEIVGGTNAGERRKITGYDHELHKITVDTAFTNAIDETSIYIIAQIGLFPRIQDVTHISANQTYYKRIPEAIRRATAAQVEYIIEKGDLFFKGGTDLKSESIDDYSYTREDSAAGLEALIAPKARLFLRGFVVRTGMLREGNPTDL